MDYGVAGAAMGLNQAIQGYLGLATQKMQEDYKQANQLEFDKARQASELENRKQLVLWEKSLDAAFKKPTATIKYGNLKKLNPKLASLGLDDNQEIPMSDLSEFSGLLPKDEGTGANPYLSIPEAAAHLYMLGVPDEKIADITTRFHKSGSKGVLKSVLDDAAKAYGANPSSSEQRLRIFANSAGIDPTDPKFIDEFRKWNTSVDNYLKGPAEGKLSLSQDAIGGAAQMATQLYEKNISSGMSQQDAFNDVSSKLFSAYDAASANAVLAQVDHQTTPRPKAPVPGFKSIVSKLLLGGK